MSQAKGLAPIIIEQLIEAIKQLSVDKTVLLVEQNFRVASLLANQYVIIDEGHSVANGQMAALVDDKALIQKYLGVA